MLDCMPLLKSGVLMFIRTLHAVYLVLHESTESRAHVALNADFREIRAGACWWFFACAHYLRCHPEAAYGQVRVSLSPVLCSSYDEVERSEVNGTQQTPRLRTA